VAVINGQFRELSGSAMGPDGSDGYFVRSLRGVVLASLAVLWRGSAKKSEISLWRFGWRHTSREVEGSSRLFGRITEDER
jgi:hypothetical protein